MKNQIYKLAAATVLVGFATAALADWPAFRGPNHDGVSTETITWPAAAPRELWRVKVGDGFGTVAVSDGRVYMMAGAGDERTASGQLEASGKGKRGGAEALLCLDAKTGNRLFDTPIGETIFESQGGNGPRTTPAVAGGKVYVVGTFLNVACIDTKTTKIDWQHDLIKDFDGQGKTNGIGNWGYAASPLVDGNLVFVAGGGPGQTFIAFDKDTGKPAWKTGDEKITHASPTIATLHGQRQIIFFVQSGLVSLDTKTGKELWRYKFDFSVSTASTPVVGGDIVYCSAGYGVGAGAVKITRDGESFKATEIWRKKNDLINHWTSVVYKDGHVYGIYGFKAYGTAPLQCVELATGNVKWSKDGFGPGGTILAGENLFVTSDTGMIGVVKATPEKYTALGGVQGPNGKTWNAAIVSGGKIYARSAKEAVCFDLATK